MRIHNEEIKKQFNLRSSTFEGSVHWVRDPVLISAHIRMAGRPEGGRAIELCCGTGAVARGLCAVGWDVTGVDISEGMVNEASKYVKAMVGDAAKLPFDDAIADLIVMRQAYFLLDDGHAVLREVRRLLKPGGKFLLSHLVPYSSTDAPHLQKVHAAKQAQMRRFFTTESLTEELDTHGFDVVARDFVTVRENVSLWMREAPELSEDKRREVCDLVLNAPENYRKVRRVELVDGEIFEDWNFVLLSAVAR
jgi:ubiquinone/menaquinone biosynthesis C-methylase UbiE